MYDITMNSNCRLIPDKFLFVFSLFFYGLHNGIIFMKVPRFTIFISIQYWEVGVVEKIYLFGLNLADNFVIDKTIMTFTFLQ